MSVRQVANIEQGRCLRSGAFKLALNAVLVGFFSLCCPALAEAQQEIQDSVIVEVVGIGPTRWSAQSNAARIALQQTMQQLVLADRVVSDSEVLKDDVISTLNGFVRRIEVVDERRVEGDFELRCRVVVSPSAVTNYISRASGEQSARQVDAGAMLGAALAVSERRRANYRLLERVLKGEGNAVGARVHEIQADSRADAVRVSLSFALDTGWIAHMESVGRAMRDGPSDPNSSEFTVHAAVPLPGYRPEDLVCNGSCALQRATGQFKSLFSFDVIGRLPEDFYNRQLRVFALIAGPQLAVLWYPVPTSLGNSWGPLGVRYSEDGNLCNTVFSPRQMMGESGVCISGMIKNWDVNLPTAFFDGAQDVTVVVLPFVPGCEGGWGQIGPAKTISLREFARDCLLWGVMSENYTLSSGEVRSRYRPSERPYTFRFSGASWKLEAADFGTVRGDGVQGSVSLFRRVP